MNYKRSIIWYIEVTGIILLFYIMALILNYVRWNLNTVKYGFLFLSCPEYRLLLFRAG